MHNDTECDLKTTVFCLLQTPHTHTHTTPSITIFYKVQIGWSKLQGHVWSSFCAGYTL